MVVDPTRAKRSYSALESKAWTANGIDPKEVTRRVEAESMVTWFTDAYLACLWSASP